MAASNKSIGLQITMAFFGMLTIGCGAGWYITHRDYTEEFARFAKATEDLSKAEQRSRDQDVQIQALAGKIGYKDYKVGHDQQGSEDTVLGAADLDLAKVTGIQAPLSNFSAAIAESERQKMSEQARAVEATASLADANRTIARLNGEYQVKVDELNREVRTVRDEKLKLESDHAEQLAQRDQTILELRDEYREVTALFDQAKSDWEDERKRMSGDLVQLEEQVDLLRDKLKNLTRVSFERPDGLVRWVDNTAGLVWINLGSDDGLRIRTTFSVYRKGHHGVARGAEDIKAQIEITRILSGGSAEARILEEDIYDPISKSDPIYTPLWSPGRTEKFAIVGLIDLDQDGILDRSRFHEIVSDAGAVLAHEVLDNGDRVRFTRFPSEWVEWVEGDAELDSDTKYLIKATIPDPTLAVQDEDKEQRQRISSQLKRMRDEARRLGIEEINLNDFLSHIGYVPQRNLYIPGVVDRPYNLRSGAASVTTNEVVGNRAAAGQVSGIFGRSKRLKPKTSSGQTSKLYSN